MDPNSIDPISVEDDNRADATFEQPNPPKRRRGRPRKVTPESLDPNIIEQPEEKKRPRRTSKLTGNDVSEGISMLGMIIASMTQEEHWIIQPAETAGYANQLADLLNRLPAHYVKSASNFAGIAVVGVGVYNTFIPRINHSRALRVQRAMQETRTETPEERNAPEQQLNNHVEVPVWGVDFAPAN